MILRLPDRKLQDVYLSLISICTGFGILYFIFRQEVFLIISLIIGLTGVFSAFLSRYIDFMWNALAKALGYVMPMVLMGVIFFLVLIPTALLKKIFERKDPLMLNDSYESTFRNTSKSFAKDSFEKMW